MDVECFFLQSTGVALDLKPPHLPHPRCICTLGCSGPRGGARGPGACLIPAGRSHRTQAGPVTGRRTA